jgi:type II secretory pathway predicted ATPase ExeA
MIETLQAHWGFTVMPFGPAIPVAALFGSAAHKEAVARLRWLISARGLGVLTGEVGSGKTAAVRAAADGLDASRHTLIYLPNPQIGVRGIHGAVAMALGQAPRFHHATLIPQVEAALAAETDERNRHVILAIDESHLMSGDQLESVRMLTLCRDRDYADGRQGCPGDRVYACLGVGIISGPRGRRGACRAAGTCPSSPSAMRSGPGPFP